MELLNPRKHEYVECSCKLKVCPICNRQTQYCSVCDCQDGELLTFCPGYTIGREVKSEIASGEKIIDLYGYHLAREEII